MKKDKVIYWTSTGLISVMTLASGLQQSFHSKSSVDVTATLQLPEYLLSLLGPAKIVGAIAILLPNLRTLREWAYAGLFIDFLGATYCMIAAGGSVSQWGF